MISVNSEPCRKDTQIKDIGTNFPTVFSTRWSSLGSATRWLISHRHFVTTYAEGKYKAPLPVNIWWIITESVKSLIFSVYNRFQSIQGRNTLIRKQNFRITDVANFLLDSFGVEGPLTGADFFLLSYDSFVVAKIYTNEVVSIVRDSKFVELLGNCGPGPEEDLARFDEEERKICLKNLAEVFSKHSTKIPSSFRSFVNQYNNNVSLSGHSTIWISSVASEVIYPSFNGKNPSSTGHARSTSNC